MGLIGSVMRGNVKINKYTETKNKYKNKNKYSKIDTNVPTYGSFNNKNEYNSFVDNILEEEGFN